MKKIVCIGEMLFELVPPEKGLPLNKVDYLVISPGGAPANVAAAVSKLGGNSRFIGKIGQDPLGEYLWQILIKTGVDVAMKITSAAQTGVTFITLSEDGERQFTFYGNPAADILINKEDIEETWLSDAFCFHFGSRSLVQESGKNAILHSVSRAKEYGAIVSFDPNIRLNQWKHESIARENVLDFLKHTDILKLNEEELVFLYGSYSEDAIRKCLASGIKVLVITLGKYGSRIITKLSDIQVPVFHVTRVDTTGAGDAFVAAMLLRLQTLNITTEKLESACADQNLVMQIFEFANAVGAITTTKYGAINALPTLEEIQAVMKRE